MSCIMTFCMSSRSSCRRQEMTRSWMFSQDRCKATPVWLKPQFDQDRLFAAWYSTTSELNLWRSQSSRLVQIIALSVNLFSHVFTPLYLSRIVTSDLLVSQAETLELRQLRAWPGSRFRQTDRRASEITLDMAMKGLGDGCKAWPVRGCLELLRNPRHKRTGRFIFFHGISIYLLCRGTGFTDLDSRRTAFSCSERREKSQEPALERTHELESERHPKLLIRTMSLPGCLLEFGHSPHIHGHATPKRRGDTSDSNVARRGRA